MLTRPIEDLQGGRAAWLAIKLIGAAGMATAWVGHRLYWRSCRLIGRFLPSTAQAQVVLAPDCRMKISLSDPYWSRLIAASYEYERDFKRVLQQLTSLEYTFIDCGANYGYWSILVTGDALGNHPTLSIEASRDTCDTLLDNCALNGDRFAVLYAALSDRSGIPVLMHAPSGHAGARIRVGNVADGAGPVVTTTTLDDAIPGHFGGFPQRLLVKLDVEGQEIKALNGASELLKRDVLLYYEDHGHDPDSLVTRHVLEDLGLRVFYCPPAGPVQEIATPRAASMVKARRTYGYNFLACRADSTFIYPLGKMR